MKQEDANAVMDLAQSIRRQAAAMESFMASGDEKEARDLMPQLKSMTGQLSAMLAESGEPPMTASELVSKVMDYPGDDSVQIFVKGDAQNPDAYYDVGNVTGFRNGPGVIIEAGEVTSVG